MIAMPPAQQPPHRRQASVELAVVEMLDDLEQKGDVELLRLRGDVVRRPCAQKFRVTGERFGNPRCGRAFKLHGRGGITCREQVFDEKTGTGAVVDNAARPAEIAPESAEHDCAEPETEVFFWKLRLPLPKARDHRRRPGHFVDDPLRFRTTLPHRSLGPPHISANRYCVAVACGRRER